MRDKPGGLGTTQIELVGWFSSPQSLNSTGGGSGSKRLHCKERTDFLVMGVCGCSRIQVGSGVGVRNSSMSSPT